MAPTSSADPPAGSSEANWLWGGILAAVFIPPVGFIVSIIVFAKGRVGHGMAILLTSITVGIIGATLACGAAIDSFEDDLASDTPRPSESAEAAADDASARPDCKQRGHERVCVDGSVTSRVAVMPDAVRLSELSAKLVDYDLLDALPHGWGRANGTYLVLTVEVTNKLNEPQSFGDQVVLLIGDNEYSRDTDAEIYYMDGGLNIVSDIQPGGSARGRLVFDLPDPAVARLERPAADATLGVLNFSDDGAFDYGPDPEELGFIRFID